MPNILNEQVLGFANKIKIPTLLGLTIIILGLGAGLVLIFQNQPVSFLTKASPDQTPTNIQISNIEDESITISWYTAAKVPGFVTFGMNSPDQQTASDDRDATSPTPRNTHHVTLKKLTPQTEYQYKIFSGKVPSNEQRITTTSTLPVNNLNPIISSVLQGSTPVTDAIAYLSISGGKLQSAPIKDYGNFIIPISKMRTDNLLSMFTPEKDTIAKITVISNLGEASAIFKIGQNQVGPLKIGQNLDLTTVTPSPTPTFTSNLNIYDLDNNRVVNASDHAIILNNFGRNPKNPKADLNKDNIVNQEDLDQMSKEILRLGQSLPSITPSPNR